MAQIPALLKASPATTVKAAVKPASASKKELQAPVEAAAGDSASASSGGRTALPTSSVVASSTTVLNRALRSARDLSDITLFLQLLEVMEEADPQVRTVLATRRAAVEALPLVVAESSDKRVDKRVAEACRLLLAKEHMQATKGALMDAVSKSFAAVNLVWAYDAESSLFMPVDAISAPQRWFDFSKENGRDIVLRSLDGQAREQLVQGQFIVHKPALKPGFSATAGVGSTLLLLSFLKSLALRDWASFVEVYGHPTAVIKHPKGISQQMKDELDVIKDELGRDTRVRIPDGVDLQLLKGVEGNSDTFEKFSRYADEQIAKVVLGQVLTTEKGGGGYALGNVHNAVREDLLRADAKALAATYKRDLITPFVRFNFGPTVAIPDVQLQIDDPEDTTAWFNNAEKFVKLGGKLPVEEARKRLNVRAPVEGEEVLEIAASEAAPVNN